MNTKSIFFFLFFAAFMLTLKPFVGFCFYRQIAAGSQPQILTKAFTKRKLEYVAGSQFDVSVMQTQLKIPVLGCLLSAYSFYSEYTKIRGFRNLIYTGLLSYFLPRYLLCRSLLI